MLACSLSPCRMYTRNTSLAEKAWKERREVFMLLFTKKKQKRKKKLLLKDWLVISRNQHVEFFFPPVNLELVRDWSLNYFVLHAVESGCVYASSRVEGVSGAVGLKPCVHFFFFCSVFKMLPLGGKGGEAHWTQVRSHRDMASTCSSDAFKLAARIFTGFLFRRTQRFSVEQTHTPHEASVDCLVFLALGALRSHLRVNWP